MKIDLQRRVPVALVSVALLAGAGCSGSFSIGGGSSPESAGEELIEGELSDKLGEELSDADCVAPAENEPGEEFTCTATTPDGETVTFEGVVEEDDEIFVAASNVILADEMSVVEEEAASVLGPEVGVEIDPSDVDCPDETTVLDDDQLRCEITDGTSGDRYVMTATFGGYILRSGFDERSYEVGDLIE